jgi:cold shock CspA family protein
MKIRERGVIVAYKDSKGYGFVRRADGLADIFFHVSEVDPEAVELVRPNALVEFTVTKDAVFGKERKTCLLSWS